MPIESVRINNFKIPMGKTPSEHDLFKIILKDLIEENLPNADLKLIDFYNMKNFYYNQYSGNKQEKKIIIFANATVENASHDVVIREPITINGIQTPFTNFLQPLGGEHGVIIKAENGLPLAEWREDMWTFNILFDLFQEYTDECLKVCKFIMKEFDRLVWIPKLYEFSWKFTQNKSNLTQSIVENIKRQKEIRINNDRIEIENLENKIREFKRNIKNFHENCAVKRRSVETEIAYMTNVSNSLIKDLDSIVNHPKIKDIQIKENKFIVFTEPLIITSDQNKRYLGGEFRIEIKPENTEIRFYGGIPNRSYWTDHDPHPHVNGRSNEACLGNIDSTIAELCASMEIYAIVMTAIDFLESANTHDVAGKRVINWQEIDENGNHIKSTSMIECNWCENMFDGDELNTAWDGEDYEGVYGEHLVCNACLENNYHANDNGDYVRD